MAEKYARDLPEVLEFSREKDEGTPLPKGAVVLLPPPEWHPLNDVDISSKEERGKMIEELPPAPKCKRALPLIPQPGDEVAVNNTFDLDDDFVQASPSKNYRVIELTNNGPCPLPLAPRPCART